MAFKLSATPTSDKAKHEIPTTRTSIGGLHLPHEHRPPLSTAPCERAAAVCRHVSVLVMRLLFHLRSDVIASSMAWHVRLKYSGAENVEEPASMFTARWPSTPASVAPCLLTSETRTHAVPRSIASAQRYLESCLLTLVL